jgi:hypothetical protein
MRQAATTLRTVLVALAVGGVLPRAAAAQEDPEEAPAPCPPDDITEYGEEGVFEVGGSVAFFWDDPEFTVAVSPSFGVFLFDYFELSAIVDLEYVNDEDPDTGERTGSTTVIAVIEPSYHLPLEEGLYLLTGLGIGVGYDGEVIGLELIPRVGLNIGIGRSGILTPAARVPILLGVSTIGEDGGFEASAAVGLEVGYTTIF